MSDFTAMFAPVVGPQSKSDGSILTNTRVDKNASHVMTQAHGKYYEAASRGVLFAASEQGTGVAPGTALGTAAILSLYNLPGSGKRLAIKKVSAAYISGTLGAGACYHCVNTNAAQTAPTGTAVTPVCTDVGNAAAPVGVVKAAATVILPVALRPFFSLTALLATTAIGLYQIEEDLDGEIVLEPGTSYQLQSVAAGGTSPKITAGLSWEEIPIV